MSPDHIIQIILLVILIFCVIGGIAIIMYSNKMNRILLEKKFEHMPDATIKRHKDLESKRDVVGGAGRMTRG